MGSLPYRCGQETAQIMDLLRRQPVRKPHAVHKSALVTLSLISVDTSAGWAENQKMAVMITSAGIHARYFFIIRMLSF